MDEGGRSLRPPSTPTPLDRAWQRRQRRLEAAHDDFALQASAGGPRARIHAATGLARLRRRTVRECVQVYRRTAAMTGVQSDAAIVARSTTADAFRAYRRAIADLADAVAGFKARNIEMAVSEALNRLQPAADNQAGDIEGRPTPVS